MINGLSKIFKFRDIRFDPWNALQFCTELQEEDGFVMVEFRQGSKTMNEPCKEFERMMLSQQLEHNNNPILNWMASNVSIKTDPKGNICPVKPEDKGVARIDGIIGAIMATAGHMFSDETDSVYESRGLIAI
jgi:phage terminase large subunit-like protein